MLPIIGNWLNRLVMRIVADAAPQLAVAVARASAGGQLLGVANHLELPGRTARRRGKPVDGEHILQPQAGAKILNLLAGIRNADHSRKMALFANTVPGSAL